jgi:hypothetical protein
VRAGCGFEILGTSAISWDVGVGGEEVRKPLDMTFTLFFKNKEWDSGRRTV